MSVDVGHKKAIDSLVDSIWPQSTIASYEVVQGLWSDYGAIIRVVMNAAESGKLSDDSRGELPRSGPSSLVAKVVAPPLASKHPRGWNTDASKLRKLRSYQVERRFYEHYAKLCSMSCPVPACLGSTSDGNAVTLLLEDLDTEYPIRHSQLSAQSAQVCLQWLAAFHAQFLGLANSLLWERGTYWYLETRADEFDAMPDGLLKQAAHRLDARLNACVYQTLLHGDAKVANFCFNPLGDRVAAVDFQYTGSGCGMRDVAYFLGSCLAEDELCDQETHLLDVYFRALSSQLAVFQPEIDAGLVEAEWRPLYAVCGADFHRFLSGWSPSHKKLTAYSAYLVTRALHIAENHS